MQYYLFTRSKIATEHDNEPFWRLHSVLPYGTQLFQFSGRYYEGEEESYDDAWEDVEIFKFATHLSGTEIADDLKDWLIDFEDWALVSQYGEVVESLKGGPATTAFSKIMPTAKPGFALVFVAYEGDEMWQDHMDKVQSSLGASCVPFFYARNGKAFVMSGVGSFESLKIPFNRHPHQTITYAGVDGDGRNFLNGKWCDQIWFEAA